MRALTFRPHSIVGLILMGYMLVLLPLAIAFLIAVFQLNRLAKQSQMTIMQVAEVTQSGRLLINQITAMERNALQYIVVRDDELLRVYEESHAAFQQTLDSLAPLNLDTKQRRILSELDEIEQQLYQVFAFPREKPVIAEVGVEKFAPLVKLARDFLTQSQAWVDHELARLQSLAENTTLKLSWLMFAVIPTVLVLTGIFATLIVRPLKDMSRAIRRLGKEDFKRPITIHGPQDLETLGKRLDWLRSRLAELDEQKARFLRHMSHELKTPLAALREGVELLNDQVVGPLNDEQREIATILRENSLRLQHLITDLLDFNHVLSRNLRLRPELLELGQLVRTVIETHRLAWKARNLQIVTDLPPLSLAGDREKLETVVDNLLSNAIKFSPSGGEIQIELKAINGMVQLEVRDSGPGFEPNERERVFEAFYQGRVVPNGHVKGSGLGLAIAREYAVAHNGNLEILDGNVQGGWVRLSLPINRKAL